MAGSLVTCMLYFAERRKMVNLRHVFFFRGIFIVCMVSPLKTLFWQEAKFFENWGWLKVFADVVHVGERSPSWRY